MTKLDHAAIRTVHYDGSTNVFLRMFLICICGGRLVKTRTQCWFKEGIQLCEATEISVSAENGYDHISLAVDSVPEIMKKTQSISCYPY